MGKSRINPGNDDAPATTGEKVSWAGLGAVLFVVAFMAWVLSVTP